MPPLKLITVGISGVKSHSFRHLVSGRLEFCLTKLWGKAIYIWGYKFISRLHYLEMPGV